MQIVGMNYYLDSNLSRPPSGRATVYGDLYATHEGNK